MRHPHLSVPCLQQVTTNPSCQPPGFPLCGAPPHKTLHPACRNQATEDVFPPPYPEAGNAHSSTPSACAATTRSCCNTPAATVHRQMCVLSSPPTPQRLHTSSA